MKKITHTTLVFAAFALVFGACKKDKENPYTLYQRVAPDVIDPKDTLDPNSIVGIHNNILKPTCANSGCHDGTFEPDYRTIESSYNTLVTQPIIKNDPNGTYSMRVVPGNAEQSVLYQRLIKDIDGQSGIMPLSVDQGSDWPTKKQQYIENIKNWINNGAKDQFGNTPGSVDARPTFLGMIGFADQSTTALSRGGAGQGTVVTPFFADSLQLLFSFKDDKTSPSAFSFNRIKISPDANNFNSAPEFSLQLINPIIKPGYLGDNVEYTHRIFLPMQNYQQGVTYYVRLYVRDANPDNTEIPGDASADYIKLYFSFTRQ